MNNRRKQIEDYFGRKSAVKLICFGILLLPAFGIGLIPLAIGIRRALRNAGLPSDAEMDGWIQEDLDKLRSVALEKTGLDEPSLLRESVFVTGLRLENTGGAKIAFRLCKDKNIRFTPIGVTVLNFTAHQLVAYQCALDLMTGKALSESTEEYFYRDIVSVSTASQSKTWEVSEPSRKHLRGSQIEELISGGRIQLNSAETFILTTSGGTSLEVVLRAPRLIELLGGGDIRTHLAGDAIKTVRQMLREKKSGN